MMNDFINLENKSLNIVENKLLVYIKLVYVKTETFFFNQYVAALPLLRPLPGFGIFSLTGVA